MIQKIGWAIAGGYFGNLFLAGYLNRFAGPTNGGA
jgi:hypothetical protein